jgi:hypothetical protein
MFDYDTKEKEYQNTRQSDKSDSLVFRCSLYYLHYFLHIYFDLVIVRACVRSCVCVLVGGWVCACVRACVCVKSSMLFLDILKVLTILH